MSTHTLSGIQMPNDAEILRELLNRRPVQQVFFPLEKDGSFKYIGSKEDPLNAAPEGMPHVPPAPMFRPGTLSGPDPLVAQMLERYFKIAPELRGRVSRVQVGPDRAAMERLIDSNMKPHEYDISSMMGIFDFDTRELSLNPALNKWEKMNDMSEQIKSLAKAAAEVQGKPVPEGFDEYVFPFMERTLAHELGHAAGYGHGKKITDIEQAVERMKGYRK